MIVLRCVDCVATSSLRHYRKLLMFTERCMMLSSRILQGDLQYVNTERLEYYRVGGYHPVRIGDRLDQDRYIIVNKLGHGDTCTVWLAEDTHQNAYVAVSILQARYSLENETPGFQQLRRLKNGDPGFKGASNLLLPLRVFDMVGQNGTHVCVVYTVQGHSICVATERHLGVSSRVLPLEKVKNIISDVATGLEYAHNLQVVHRGEVSRDHVQSALPQC